MHFMALRSLNLYSFKYITSLIFNHFCSVPNWCPKRAFSSLMG